MDIKIKNSGCPVPDDNPFEYDVLNRGPAAEVLTQFISVVDEPFVLSINSKWGTGKTTFIEMWRKALKKSGFQTLYFNAWENDFAADPFVAFMAEIRQGLRGCGFDDERQKQTETFFEKHKDFAVNILKNSIPAVVKIATSGVINMDGDVKDTVASAMADFAKDSFDSYIKTKEGMENFRKDLEQFMSEISRENESRPLVFFIDELDRCRPTYAIELLERVKHLFNVKGIVFILSIDKDQLQHSIKAVYGTGFDVDGYLRRFIDVDYSLPEPSRKNFVGLMYRKLQIKQFFERKEKESGKRSEDEIESLIHITNIFIEMHSLSLREIEHYFTRLSIVLRTLPPMGDVFPALLPLLLVLRIKAPDYYAKFKSGAISTETLIEYFTTLPGGMEFFDSDYGPWVEAYLVCYTPSDRGFSEIKEKYDNISENCSDDQEKKYRANRILSIINDLSFNGKKRKVELLHRRIDLIESLNFV